MISWQWSVYKLLLSGRLVHILFFNGHHRSDEFGNLVEVYMTFPWHFSLEAKNSSMFPSNVTRTHLFPLVFSEIPSIFTAVFRRYLKSYSLLIFTPFFVNRLFSCWISLIIDYFIFRIARNWRVKPNLVLFLYSSSYVPWIYFTFSRSCLVETILFTAFLYFVVASIPFWPETGHEQRAITGGISHHAHSHGLSHGTCTASHEDHTPKTSKCAFFLGFIFALGISNRLNFFVFALAPLVQWFLSNESSIEKNGVLLLFLELCRKVCNFILGLALGIVCVSIVDSVAIGMLQVDGLRSVENIEDLFHLFARNLTFASWNSLRLVLSFRSLAGRSSHPWYTHILINTPLIFGLFGFCIFLYFVQCFRWEVLWRLHYINARYWFLLSSFIVPLVALSIYPRKYPEDLCPLLVPLTLVMVIRISQYELRLQARLVIVWFTWNCFGVLYYGILYNGRLYDCVAMLESSRIHSNLSNATYAYHYFGTDKPPSLVWISSDLGMKNQFPAPMLFHYSKDEKSKFRRRLRHSMGKFSTVYAVVPSTISICEFWSTDSWQWKLVDKYSWHYSPESPPNFWYLFGCSQDPDGRSSSVNGTMGNADCRVPCMDRKWNQLYEMLTLKLYRIV